MLQHRFSPEPGVSPAPRLCAEPWRRPADRRHSALDFLCAYSITFNPAEGNLIALATEGAPEKEEDYEQQPE